MTKILFFSLLVCFSLFAFGQSSGDGSSFERAISFSENLIADCPHSATSFSNQILYPVARNNDACMPSPQCSSVAVNSEVWYSFVASSTAPKITVSLGPNFSLGIQALAGSGCGSLVEIGCVGVGANGATINLQLSGLTINSTYLFRLFSTSGNSSDGLGSFNFCGSSGLGGTVLPAQIINFSAAITDTKKVLVNWVTASESANAYFEVERSADGISFGSIGRVSGRGNSAQPTAYNFTDGAPLGKINYYRLKQVDVDGRSKYSNIIPVKMEGSSAHSLMISPNPVTDLINIKVNAEKATTTAVKITDAAGKVVYQGIKKINRGINAFSLTDVNRLGKGIYILQMLVDDNWISTKFMSVQ